MSRESAFWKIVRDQFGLIRVSQALAVGITRGQLRHWTKVGRLEQVAYGILRAVGAPRVLETDEMFGVLLGTSRAVDGGIRSCLCGISSAMRLDLAERRPNPIHVLSQRKVAPRDGYVFRWTSRLPDAEIVRVDGIPTTDGPRCFLDLCSDHPQLARWAYRRGLRRDRFTRAEVEERIDIESRQGRQGLTLAREIVATTDSSAGEARSAEEDIYFDYLVRAGYPPPKRNVKVRGASGIAWEIDLFYPPRSKGFEISPYDTHGGPRTHVRDGDKVLDLARAGITIYPINERLSFSVFTSITRDLLGAPGSF